MLNFLPDDGLPFSIDVKANVVGPTLRVDTPGLNFGLFIVSQVQKQKFKMKNISPIDANFIIKESRFKHINFDTIMDTDHILRTEGIIASIPTQGKITSLDDFENQAHKMEYTEYDSYQIQYDYIASYLDFSTGYPEFKVAKENCKKYKDFPLTQ